MDFNKIIEGTCGFEAAINFLNYLVKFFIVKIIPSPIIFQQNFPSIIENACKNYVK
jgi:hypothetical protein